MPRKTLHKKRRPAPRQIVRTKASLDRIGDSAVCYQLERVKCGKGKCRKWHGPYWYAYWSAAGRTRTLYIGKTLRPAPEVAAELVERRRAAAAALTTGESP